MGSLQILLCILSSYAAHNKSVTDFTGLYSNQFFSVY